jgi:predicted nuclease of predicted toxin-antitoxin system
VKFLADENFPIDSVTLLRHSGFEVESIQESFPSLGDEQVLRRAVQHGSILLTFDRDFGDLIFNHHFPAPLGIVFFRFDLLNSDEPGHLVLKLISEIKIEGYITVVSRSNLRQRELPS